MRNQTGHWRPSLIKRSSDILYEKNSTLQSNKRLDVNEETRNVIITHNMNEFSGLRHKDPIIKVLALVGSYKDYELLIVNVKSAV